MENIGVSGPHHFQGMQMLTVPMKEIAHRLTAFQGLLAGKGLDAALIHQNTDLFYFAGTAQDGFLVVPASGRPVLLVKRDMQRALEQSPIRPIDPHGRSS